MFRFQTSLSWQSSRTRRNARAQAQAAQAAQAQASITSQSLSISPRSRTQCRQFSTNRVKHRQRLFWSGSVLDRTSARFKLFPKDWLYSVGMIQDADQGISWTDISASPSHSLLSYKTLPPLSTANSISAPSNSTSEDYDSDSDSGPEADPEAHSDLNANPNPEGLHKVMAIGRNSFAELGLGFASQESTWGMTRPGFQGQMGVGAVQTGLATSWLVCHDSQDHTSFQLGHGSNFKPTSESGESQLEIYPVPKQVDLRESFSSSSSSSSSTYSASTTVTDEPIKIIKISSGLDHTLLLVRRESCAQNEILVCGLNTDGQLGLGSSSLSLPHSQTPSNESTSLSTFQPLSSSSFNLDPEDDLVGISAGGDTSFAWTKKGRLFSWGNSEYGQALGNEIQDQILEPREVLESNQEMGKVKDVKVGGSFVVVLDDLGQVFTCGYGSIGQGPCNISTVRPTRVQLPFQSSEKATSIHCGLENSAIATNLGRVFVFGLDSHAGRLGLGKEDTFTSFLINSRFAQSAEEGIELRVFEPKEVELGLKDQVAHAIEGKSGKQEIMKGKKKEKEKEKEKENEGKIEILKVALGRDATWILVEDGQDEVGRWDPT